MFNKDMLRNYWQKDISKTFAASIFAHLIVILLFMIFHIGFDFTPPDFAEVAFVSGESLLSSTAYAQAGQQQFDNEQRLLQEDPLHNEKQENDVVQIPKRRMLENERPQLNVRDSNKQVPAEAPTNLPAKRDAFAEDRSVLPAIGDRTRNAKLRPGVTRMQGTEKESPSAFEGTGSYADQPFQIEGEAAQRQILYKKIPEYPSGLQSEATVKVQFSVLPDGSVGEMIPLIKGNATLENLTLNAFRQWRFNPLSPNAPQRITKGVITFRYLLK